MDHRYNFINVDGLAGLPMVASIFFFFIGNWFALIFSHVILVKINIFFCPLTSPSLRTEI